MAKKKVATKGVNKLKEKLAKKRGRKPAADACGLKKKGPGRPAYKKPVIGFEISSKDQNKLGSDFSNLQKNFDTIGENVSKFAFEADPKAATTAFKEIVSFQKTMKVFCKTVRTIKKNLKPKYGELTA
jgi:hypothetical protein